MRILLSNPDAIGDFVLRQPMLQSLAGAGHTLMLVVRPHVEPIARLVCPKAQIVICTPDPFAETFDIDESDQARSPTDATFANPSADLLAAVTAFDPDLFVCASYAWTPLEEWLVDSLRSAPVTRAGPSPARVRTMGVAAMSGSLKHDPTHGPGREPTLEPDILVRVDKETPELTKNERLASALLGRSLRLGDPKLVADESALRCADAQLSRLALDPGEFFIACVASPPGDELRNLEADSWGEILSRWADAHGRRFLLVGTDAEQAGLEDVLAAMGEARSMASVWTGSSPESIATLVGLTSRSAGYAGRDTGPMHIAAALGKPVVAVFGGGTWPRFMPAIDQSVAITIGVPCAGCDWRCHLPEAYCIRRVPLGRVLAAADAIESGRVSSRQIVTLEPDRALLSTIARQGGESARERLTLVSVMRRTIESGRDERESAAVATVETLTARLADRDENLAQLRSRLAEERRARDERVSELKATRSVLDEVRSRARSAEERLARRTDELVASSSRAASAGEKANAVERAMTARLDSVRQNYDRLRTDTEQNLVRLADQDAQLDQARDAAQASDDARHDLAKQLAATQRRERDLRATISRLESDRKAMAALSAQQARDLGVVRRHLDELLASRWRRLGQRMGVAMTLPWEEQMRNGRG
ncbi:MAG: hypothetical protein IIC49_02450 [Planctomycetes bacterium]|nr:hypothetical protein [Planctomycetota bacterium]